jgi:hypothetical protein
MFGFAGLAALLESIIASILSVTMSLLASFGLPTQVDFGDEPTAEARSLLAVGCSSSAAEGGNCLGEFLVVSATRNGVEAPTISADPPTLRVRETKVAGELALSVSTNCNAVSTTVRASGSQLSRILSLNGLTWTTVMGCGGPDQERPMQNFFNGQTISVKALPDGGVELSTRTGGLTLKRV